MAITYRDAGVDVEAGYEAVRLMRKHVEKTFNKNVLTGLGGFGGLYELEGGQVLVAGTDGVGTKLKLAFALNRHDTIGIDCVAMCVNDVVCHGARPLFFLDYIATGRLDPARISEIVGGVAQGCLLAGAALIGGETAEMPGFYPAGEYDIAGFAVGSVQKSDMIIGKHAVKDGDALVGLASSGMHSNGFSLIRKLVDMQNLSIPLDSLGCTLGEELLKPTRIYVKPVLRLIDEFSVHGIAHITGGGFFENIPRILPEGFFAKIQLGSWKIQRIFDEIRLLGDVGREQLYNTFNMGIGMVLAVPQAQARAVVARASELGETAYIIGEVARGGSGVELCG